MIDTADTPSELSLTDVRLLGEDLQIPALTDSVNAAPLLDEYRLWTALLRVEDPPIGRHEIDAIAFVDESGERVTSSIGAWTLDVRLTGDPVVTPVNHSVGAFFFGPVEATLRNDTDESVALDGLFIDQPAWNISSGMSLPGSASASDGEPAAASAVSVLRAEITPGAELDVSWELSSPVVGNSPFVSIAPFLVVRVDGGELLAPFPMQVYSQPFEDDAAIATYISELPAEARLRPP